MVEVWTKIVALLILPPGVIIVVALFGLLIQIRWVLLGSIIFAISIAALLILSLPLTGYDLMSSVESRFPPLPHPLPRDASPPAEAIVVLGGGRYTDAAEYGAGDTVNRLALERLRYAAYLHRLTGLPILVSGGAPFGEPTSEAELMQTTLERDFQIKVKWVEDKSATTFENAQYSQPILAGAGIRRIYLVTHAVHMPRAVWTFENMGLSTVPAPMGFTTLSKAEREILGYLPSIRGLKLSSMALHEQLGLMWYQRTHRDFGTQKTSVGAQ